MKRILGLLLLVLMGLALFPAYSWAGEWGLGIGVAARQAPQKDTDVEVVAMPFPQYDGERLSATFGSVSYLLTSSDRFRVALEGQLRFDGYKSDESAALNGMKDRDVTLDAGFSVATSDTWGVLSLKFLGDALGVHEGYEISASYQYPLQFENWTLVPSISVKMPSADLVDYYYGVRATEATADRTSYAGKSAINTAIGMNAIYQIADHWQFAGGAEYVRLGSGIADSPIIERDHEATVFSALVYRF